MKFIVHIKCPASISQTDITKVQQDCQNSFGPDYLVVVTSDNIDINVYPKFIYNTAMFVDKVKRFFVKVFEFVCKPVS